MTEVLREYIIEEKDNWKYFLASSPGPETGHWSIEINGHKEQICKNAPLDQLLNDPQIDGIFRRLKNGFQIELTPKEQNDLFKKMKQAVVKCKEDIHRTKNEADGRSNVDVVSEETKTVKRSDIIWDVSNTIIELNKIITFEDSEESFYYNEKMGIYRPAEAFLKKQATDQLKFDVKLVTRNNINEVINQVKIFTFVERDMVKSIPELICVNNGILDVVTGKFMEHSPDFWFFSKLPVRYDPTAMCTAIDTFFKEVFQDDDIPVIEELLGYLLIRSYKYHKAFMLYGEGGTGKTTFLNLLHAFLGEDNIANVSLQSIVYQRFAAIELHNKLANIYDDLSAIPLKITGKFKMATGESKIFGDRKHIAPITFYNHAKLLFACNKLPDTEDIDYAFFRRWIVIEFKNNFIKKGIADENKLEELSTPQELSGLLNKAIHGLQRLYKQGGFSQSNSIDEVMQFWLRESNTVSAFKDAWLIVDADPQSIITKDDMYAAYCDYCRLNDCVPLAKNTFGDNLIKLCGTKIRTTRAGSDKRKYSWAGVRFQDLDDTSLVDSNAPLDPFLKNGDECV